MKYSEAIKKAMKNAEFANMIQRFKAQVAEDHIAGSVQFHIGDEAFYFGGEAVYNEATGEHETYFKGGKHSPNRAAYLIRTGYSMEIK